MKKILYLCIAITFLSIFTGCDKFIDDTDVINIESLESGFKTEQNADQAILAIYPEIKSRDGLNGRTGHVLFDCGSSDLKITRESNSVNNFTFSSSTDDQAIAKGWYMWYQVIGRCNSAIELIPNTSAPDAKKSAYNSEAKVIRSVMYYYLMMAYKNCPLILSSIAPTDKDGLRTPDATRDQIYTQIIADLEEAIANTNFPWEKNYATNKKGKVGQATARTILTYVYLTRGWEKNSAADFGKAKVLAKEVIDLGGYTLEPVLLDAYYKKFSTENIWELVCSIAEKGMGNTVAPWFAPLTKPVGFTGDPKLYNGWFKLNSTQNLYEAFEDGDARRWLLAYGTGVNKEWAPKFLGGNKYGGPVVVVDAIKDNDLGKAAYQNGKGTSPADWAGRLEDNTSGTNWVIYRLSDVYLLYAEACLKASPSDEAEARTYINKVRERARNTWTAHLALGDPAIPAHITGVPADIALTVTGDALLAALKQERRIELNAEMKRVLDLRRWSLGGAKDLENDVKISTSGVWAEKYKWYPKPADQVRLSEGTIIQNDGF